MAVTASELRQDIYRLLDHVRDTGESLIIERKGRQLRIEAVDAGPPNKLERIRGNPDAIVGDPEELIHIDWTADWRPFV